MVLSISFSAVLLNSVLNYAGSMDEERYVRRGSVTDFDVRSADYNRYMLEDYGKTVPQQAVELLRAVEPPVSMQLQFQPCCTYIGFL